MKVRAIREHFTPAGHRRRGDEYDVSEKAGANFIASGLVQEVVPGKPKVVRKRKPKVSG